MSNPFTVAHKALWASFAAVDTGPTVKAGNRIDFSDTSGTRAQQLNPKESVQEGDLPELMLLLQSVARTGGDSDNFGYTLTYVWAGSSGTYNVDVLYPVLWLLAKTTEHLEATKGSHTIGDPAVRFITGVTDPSGIVTDIDANLNRGIKGLSTLWTTQVETMIPTSEFQP